MYRRLTATIVITGALFAISSPAMAGGGHHAAASVGSCTVDGSVVSAAGLPTDQVINFMMTDNSGTSSWALGYTDTGTWNVSVPPQNGATSYQFISRTSGSNGSRYTVFASC